MKFTFDMCLETAKDKTIPNFNGFSVVFDAETKTLIYSNEMHDVIARDSLEDGNPHEIVYMLMCLLRASGPDYQDEVGFPAQIEAISKLLKVKQKPWSCDEEIAQAMMELIKAWMIEVGNDWEEGIDIKSKPSHWSEKLNLPELLELGFVNLGSEFISVEIVHRKASEDKIASAVDHINTATGFMMLDRTHTYFGVKLLFRPINK